MIHIEIKDNMVSEESLPVLIATIKAVVPINVIPDITEISVVRVLANTVEMRAIIKQGYSFEYKVYLDEDYNITKVTSGTNEEWTPTQMDEMYINNSTSVIEQERNVSPWLVQQRLINDIYSDTTDIFEDDGFEDEDSLADYSLNTDEGLEPLTEEDIEKYGINPDIPIYTREYFNLSMIYIYQELRQTIINFLRLKHTMTYKLNDSLTISMTPDKELMAITDGENKDFSSLSWGEKVTITEYIVSIIDNMRKPLD